MKSYRDKNGEISRDPGALKAELGDAPGLPRSDQTRVNRTMLRSEHDQVFDGRRAAKSRGDG